MTTGVSIQTYARIAGALGLLSFVGGGFGEAYVPSVLIVREDAGATARNILASESLFRLGFAGYLLEALCDVGLTWAFYILLRPVHRNLALLAVFFRLIATGGFARRWPRRWARSPRIWQPTACGRCCRTRTSGWSRWCCLRWRA